jgi:hypothetical protein
MKLAKRQKYLNEDPGEDTNAPDQIGGKAGDVARTDPLAHRAISDLHDLCLLYIVIFCGPRSSEVFGSSGPPGTASR